MLELGTWFIVRVKASIMQNNLWATYCRKLQLNGMCWMTWSGITQYFELNKNNNESRLFFLFKFFLISYFVAICRRGKNLWRVTRNGSTALKKWKELPSSTMFRYDKLTDGTGPCSGRLAGSHWIHSQEHPKHSTMVDKKCTKYY